MIYCWPQATATLNQFVIVSQNTMQSSDDVHLMLEVGVIHIICSQKVESRVILLLLQNLCFKRATCSTETTRFRNPTEWIENSVVFSDFGRKEWEHYTFHARLPGPPCTVLLTTSRHLSNKKGFALLHTGNRVSPKNAKVNWVDSSPLWWQL